MSTMIVCTPTNSRNGTMSKKLPSVNLDTRVCKSHFRDPEDYKPNSKRLRKDAVPSLNLPPIEGEGVQEPADQEMDVGIYALPESGSEEEDDVGGVVAIADSEEEEEDECWDGSHQEDWEGLAVSDDEDEDMEAEGGIVTIEYDGEEEDEEDNDDDHEEDVDQPMDVSAAQDAASASPDQDHLLQEKDKQIEELQRRLAEKDAKNAKMRLSLRDKGLQISSLKRQVKRLTGTKVKRIKELQARSKTWRQTLRKTQEAKEKLRSKRLTKAEIRKELLKDKDAFTPEQVNFFFGKTKRPAKKWSEDRLNQALVIRCKSKSVYQLLRKNKIAALPGLSTLNTHIKKIKVSEGLMHSSLAALSKKIELEGMDNPRYKAGVLSFDEIKVGEQMSFDHREKQVLPSTKNAQICMVRGLFSPWKTPTYVGLDKPMTKEIFNEVVIAAEKAGCHVEACVSDMGSSNRGFWTNIMGVDIIKDPSIPNPADPTRRIDLFSDVPHLLKLWYAHFLDSGYVLPNGAKFVKEDLRELLDYDCNEKKLQTNMTEKHFTIKGMDRQRVFYAGNVFSGTTASLLEYIHEEKGDLIDCVRLVDRWFDVLNARVKLHPKGPHKDAYGVHLEEQNRVLDEMFDFIQKVRKIRPEKPPQETAAQSKGKKKKKKKKPALVPFQQGIAQSCVALKKLFARMKAKYNCRYLLTSHLNQGQKLALSL